jgi:hypothetical protein
MCAREYWILCIHVKSFAEREVFKKAIHYSSMFYDCDCQIFCFFYLLIFKRCRIRTKDNMLPQTPLINTQVIHHLFTVPYQVRQESKTSKAVKHYKYLPSPYPKGKFLLMSTPWHLESGGGGRLFFLHSLYIWTWDQNKQRRCRGRSNEDLRSS